MTGADRQGGDRRLSDASFRWSSGMVKGLRSPDAMQLDLLRTYNAVGGQTLLASCGCRRRCPIFSPRSRWRWRPRWSARSSANCRRGRWRGWARGCCRAATTARPCRSGRRCSWRRLLAAGLVAIIGGDRAGGAARGWGWGGELGSGALILFWLAAWALNRAAGGAGLARRAGWRLAVPALFGVTLLVVWEGLVRGLEVPAVILPPPSAIWARDCRHRCRSSGRDFVQTFLKGALSRLCHRLRGGGPDGGR